MRAKFVLRRHWWDLEETQISQVQKRAFSECFPFVLFLEFRYDMVLASAVSEISKGLTAVCHLCMSAVSDTIIIIFLYVLKGKRFSDMLTCHKFLHLFGFSFSHATFICLINSLSSYRFDCYPHIYLSTFTAM